jgi:hypothetical protein
LRPGKSQEPWAPEIPQEPWAPGEIPARVICASKGRWLYKDIHTKKWRSLRPF